MADWGKVHHLKHLIHIFPKYLQTLDNFSFVVGNNSFLLTVPIINILRPWRGQVDRMGYAGLPEIYHDSFIPKLSTEDMLSALTLLYNCQMYVSMYTSIII